MLALANINFLEKLVIIPTYNEKDNIAQMLHAIFSLQQDFHVLVIDDNSPDGTGEIVKSLFPKYPGGLFLEERKNKAGLGTAYIHGFRWALSKGYRFIFEMDCDFSHDPKDLPRLLHACEVEGADVSIGSRYVRGGKVKNWPIGRILMSYFASVYVRMILFIGIADTTAGFMCYKAEVLRSMNLDNIQFKGYAFQIEMKYAAKSKGYKIKEVPIVFTDRLYGESKMSSGIFKEALLGVWKMRNLKV